jgi:hypothetical protein
MSHDLKMIDEAIGRLDDAEKILRSLGAAIGSHIEDTIRNKRPYGFVTFGPWPEETHLIPMSLVHDLREGVVRCLLANRTSLASAHSRRAEMERGKREENAQDPSQSH